MRQLPSLSKTRWRILAVNAAWLLLIVAAYAGIRAYQQRTLVEGPAPVLRAPLLDGGTFDLAAQRGQSVLVYFWATWCPICRMEQGSIDALARDRRVVTVALQSGSAAEVGKYLREHDLGYPVVNDPDGALAAAWGVRATPAFFVVDGNGRIRFRELGYTSGPGLRLRLWFAG